MKKCKLCGEHKDTIFFPKRKKNIGNDGLCYMCKECRYVTERERYRTKKYVVKLIYSNQKINSKTRGHNPPTYNRKELKEWLYSKDKFHVMYDNWKSLDYQKEYKPSVDRVDDNIGYTMANIQLMTFGDNLLKANKDIADGFTKTTKTILQYTKSGNFVCEYISAAQAERVTGISKSAICCDLKEKTKHSGGFIWKYKEI